MKTSCIVSAVAVLAAALVPISVLAAPGDLYVAVDGAVVKFAQDGTKITVATGLNSPYGLAFDGAGNLFVGDTNTNAIYKFTPSGTKSTFATGLSFPFSLAFDSAGNLFEADTNGMKILKFKPDGSRSTFTSGIRVAGLAFDRAGNLFATDLATNTIFKFTPDGVTRTTFATLGGNATGLAFDSAGNLFVADFGSGGILEFTPAGTKSTFATGLNSPYSLAFDSAGNLFEADAGSGSIFIFTPSQFPFATGLFRNFGLAIEPTRHQFLNVSTRALVGTGDNALIGGFIMNGNGQVDDVVVVRAIGPSLTAFGVAGALQDPTLELRAEDGTLIATNDSWKTRSDGGSQQALIESTGLAPTDPRESAIYARLPAGQYTTIVRGVSSSTGIAVVEVYNLQ